MTPLQLEALDFVRERLTTTGLAPRVEDVRARFGLSSRSRAHAILTCLVDAGYLVRVPTARRGLRLADAPDLRVVDSAAMVAELQRRGEVPGKLSEPERRAVGREVSCAASCCGNVVRPGKMFCRDHWFAIPPAVQTELLSAHATARRVRDRETEGRYQAAFYVAREHADRLVRVAA